MNISKKILRAPRHAEKNAAWMTLALMAALAAFPARAEDKAKDDGKKDAPKKESKEEDPEYRNWVEITAGNIWTSGNKNEAQHRMYRPSSVFGGVSDFHYEQDVGKDKKSLFQIDGRGILNEDNYAFRLDLTNPEFGYVRTSFEQFRTFYNGEGGYLPGLDRYGALYPSDFAIDRGEIKFEAGLTLENKPQVSFRYTHQYRDGKKDSTSWGDTSVTAPFLGTSRKIMPTWLGIDETRDIFELDASHKIGKTAFGGGLRFDLYSTKDSRNAHLNPGEAGATPDRYFTQKDRNEGDMFNVHAFTETRFNDKVLFTTGYSFMTLDSDVSGSRIFGADYDPGIDIVSRRVANDRGFLGLDGDFNTKQYLFNASLMLTPWQNVTIVPAVRVEKQDQDGTDTYTETVLLAGAISPAPISAMRDRSFVDLTESLEVRYTGITNWVFYTKAEWLEGDGTLKEQELGTTPPVDRFTDSGRFTQKYSVGANWYPLRKLNLAGQYYHKTRQNDYDHSLDNTPNTAPDRYPAFIRDHDFTTDDVNFRLTWRPHPKLTTVSRYDFQKSTYDTRGDLLAEVQSADVNSHIFSESITWSPLNRLYFQGSVSYALDKTTSGAVTWPATAGTILDSKNDYWTTTFAAGIALSDKADLRTQYTYYRADNYVDNSLAGLPLGSGAEEHGVTSTLTYKIRKNMIASLQYGFFRGRDELYGTRRSYDAHLAMMSWKYLF